MSYLTARSVDRVIERGNCIADQNGPEALLMNVVGREGVHT